MAKVYKIHPGIGFARVGKSKDGYFLAPETPEGAPLELSDTAEIPFAGYKDASHLIRRQAARFRIFEYEDNGGVETFVREITTAEARIDWNVTLASRKAAGPMMGYGRDSEGARLVLPGTGYRNDPPPGYTRDDLIASVSLAASGASFKPQPEPMAKFLRKDFYIGEARTDFAGRLVVLGGTGHSATWTEPASPLTEFLNNRGWHDDIADGPVDAKITLTGSQDAVDAVGAWVVVGPPDFAPAITAITTLYDIAVQARLGENVGTVSYTMDIEPILTRVANYYWINSAGEESWKVVQEFLADPAKLADNSDANKPFRVEVEDLISEASGILSDLRMTKRQVNLLEAWREGAFIPGPDPQRAVANAADALDAAALTGAVGGGFFPGIEAGVLLRQPKVYSGLARLTRGSFPDQDVNGSPLRQLEPGSLTERMACPWQADFVECFQAWWPAQRPDIVRHTESGAQPPIPLQWDRRVRIGNANNHESRMNMIDRFAQLGVMEPMVVGGKTVFAEKGRDPALDLGV